MAGIYRLRGFVTRVAVFIDYQNVYKQARKVFDLDADSFTAGQVFPLRLGVLLTDRGRTVDQTRDLVSVRIYRGEPSAKHSPKGQAACQRQVRYWGSQALVTPWTRPLHYYHQGQDAAGNDLWEAREKGIDVKLAVDMVVGAMGNDYDVAVLCSGDTDFEPAMEDVIAAGKRCEVMAWRTQSQWSPRLKLDSQNLWCHWLDRHDYDMVCDPSDYTMALPNPPSSNP